MSWHLSCDSKRYLGAPAGVVLSLLLWLPGCAANDEPGGGAIDGVVGTGGSGAGGGGDSLPAADRYGTVWAPTMHWSVPNPSYDGNPFDLDATVTFTHNESEESRTTAMFFEGDDSWAFRFTGTRVGMWRWQSHSEDVDLDGHVGTVWMEPNPGARGFVTNLDGRWGWTGTGRTFVPQYVMYASPDHFFDKPELIDAAIDRFIVGHGFTGLHIKVFCRWAELEQPACDQVADRNPDRRTFEALEMAISKVHEAGGAVHLWSWGDHQRHYTPKDWGDQGDDGLNGPDDLRIQRYIAARLGPLPGWTMGYGFDLDEWAADGQALAGWHTHMHEQLGWSHQLGGRSGGPNSGTDHSDQQLHEALDYSGYEHHRPSYEIYVAAVDARPDNPSFSEDRFRVRDSHPDKDYDELMTRRGLIHSAMAGGVANIWGYLLDDGLGGDPSVGLSHEYPHPHWIKTYATFFDTRFAAVSERCSQLTDGICLASADRARFIFYREDASSVQLDLSDMDGSQPAVAVDAAEPYAEIAIGPLGPESQVWTAPTQSDWLIAVGDFTP